MEIFYYKNEDKIIRFVELNGNRYYSTYDLSKAVNVSRANMSHYTRLGKIVEDVDPLTGFTIKFKNFNDESYIKSNKIINYIKDLEKNFSKKNLVYDCGKITEEKIIDMKAFKKYIFMKNNKPYFQYSKIFIPLGYSESFFENRLRLLKNNFVIVKMNRINYCNWENFRKFILVLYPRRVDGCDTALTRLYEYCEANRQFDYYKFMKVVEG